MHIISQLKRIRSQH